MEPECNFWGVKIPPGAAAEVSPAFKEDFITSVHLTQVALGDKPKAGGHTIFIEKGGEKFALGTLDKDRCTHFSLDIHLATDTIRLSHTGKSDVYLTGYEAVSVATDDEPGFPGMIPSDDEDEESEEEDSEDEEAPQGVPMGKGNRMVMIDDEAEEGSSDDEEEDGSGEDGEDGLMASGEEDSDEDEDDESDEDDEDEEDEEEEESSEEEEPVPPPKSGSKRAQPPLATPQPPKRSKQEAAAGKQKAPATAPPKVAAAPTPAGGNGEYLAALKSYLSTHGPTKLATLGSQVKRPPKVPKLKHFLEQNKGVFKYNVGTDTVSLS